VLIVVTTAGVGDIIIDSRQDTLGQLFILTLLVVGESAGATVWLRSEARRARGGLT
jgi:hypothetical protein